MNTMETERFKAGLVPIIGRPNVGKSTLINSLTGSKLSIVTPKAQTTRRRILGVVNGENYQIVFADTPGVIDPAYELHNRMMKQVKKALSDADVILLMTEPKDNIELWNENPLNKYVKLMQETKMPVVVMVNKTDTISADRVEALRAQWDQWLKERFTEGTVVTGSALTGEGLNKLIDAIVNFLPYSHPLFPPDQITDITERLWVAEIIREKIFLQYRQEVPYSTEVIVTDWQDKEHIVVIKAEIIVERDSQKKILIGKGGSAIKKIGIQAREEIEQMLGKKVYLELFVKVRRDWRERNDYLKYLGYE